MYPQRHRYRAYNAEKPVHDLTIDLFLVYDGDLGRHGRDDAGLSEPAVTINADVEGHDDDHRELSTRHGNHIVTSCIFIDAVSDTIAHGTGHSKPEQTRKL